MDDGIADTTPIVGNDKLSKSITYTNPYPRNLNVDDFSSSSSPNNDSTLEIENPM